MSDVRLTIPEREALAMGADFNCPSCGHLYASHYNAERGCRRCRFSAGDDCTETVTTALGKAMAPAVEAILAARLAEHRRDWASWLESWSAAVAPVPPTVEAVIAWLRVDYLPFGVSANPATALTAAQPPASEAGGECGSPHPYAGRPCDRPVGHENGHSNSVDNRAWLSDQPS